MKTGRGPQKKVLFVSYHIYAAIVTGPAALWTQKKRPKALFVHKENRSSWKRSEGTARALMMRCTVFRRGSGPQ